MSIVEHDAVAIHERHGTYTLWMSVGGRDVEIAYRPASDAETDALATSLRARATVVVKVEAGIFIRGVRAK